MTGRLEKPPSVRKKDPFIRNGWWLRRSGPWRGRGRRHQPGGQPAESVGQGVHEHAGQCLVRRCRAGDERRGQPAASTRRVVPCAAAGRPGSLGRALATAVSMPRIMWPSSCRLALCAGERPLPAPGRGPATAGRGIRFGGPGWVRPRRPRSLLSLLLRRLPDRGAGVSGRGRPGCASSSYRACASPPGRGRCGR
jgi:hypothetical protein